MDEGLVVVLFTDVEGSTELSTRRGDAAARDMLRIHEELVRAQVAGHEGRVAGGRGDGFLVTFRSARRALACAVGIQRALEEHADRAPQEHVRVRIGINVGEVSQEQGELYGAAVNAAARISAQGSGRQIIVASVVKELAGTMPGISFLDRGWVRLRGFLEDSHLYEVAWRRETAARGASVPRTPLVGRETEMATLHELAQAALGGRGALVMLGGEPGVGKTRLAEELTAEAAGSGMLALTGRCYEMAGSPPYLPFIELLEAMARIVPHERFREALSVDAAQVAKLVPELHRLFPDIPPPLTLPAEHERRYVFNCVRDFIQRASRLRPLLLVLEDLHWADDATLALLRHLTETVRGMPVLILGTYRDVEVSVRHPLADLLHDIGRRRLCRQIAVGRLPQEDVAAMVGAITGQDPPRRVVAAIHDETEGNPFFIEEVVRYLADEGRLVDARGRLLPDLTIGDLDVPHSVRFVIGRRLARLSESTQRALTVAAVVGRGFSVELLQAMGEADTAVLLDAIDEAEPTHMVVPVEGGRSAGYRFAHELIRQTLMAGMSLARRQRLHLQAAEALQRMNDQSVETEAVEVAHHLVEAGPLSDRRTTVRYLTVAADHATAAAAFEDGLHHLRTALSLLPDDDRCGHAALLEKLARALHRLGQWDEALDAWREASTVYEERGDLEAVGRVCTKMAMRLDLGGRDAECRAAVELDAAHGL
jgi:predicted ATPase/class 3 adenylate cyclase